MVRLSYLQILTVHGPLGEQFSFYSVHWDLRLKWAKMNFDHKTSKINRQLGKDGGQRCFKSVTFSKIGSSVINKF